MQQLTFTGAHDRIVLLTDLIDNVTGFHRTRNGWDGLEAEDDCGRLAGDATTLIVDFADGVDAAVVTTVVEAHIASQSESI
tara:strand:+ start:218 stop:460 length:243 start_codon:yes stop_codon:yes gene_type:complete